MKLYVVTLTAPNKGIEARINKMKNDDWHRYTGTVYFIASNKSAQEVAEEIGLKGKNRSESASGVVLKMNGSYSGFTKRGLWEWFESVDVDY